MINTCLSSGIFKTAVLTVLICTYGLLENLHAQFVSVQLELQAEIETTIVSELNFGNAVINTGEQSIQLGDPNMGIFQIKTYKTQIVNLRLETPENLTHVDPLISDRIPISIQSSYSNSGINNYRNSTMMENNEAFIRANNVAGDNETLKNPFYIYIFGSVDIGTINQGIYTGEIRLIIDYQ